MRCRSILLSGAFVLASSLVFTPGFAQNTSAAASTEVAGSAPAPSDTNSEVRPNQNPPSADTDVTPPTKMSANAQAEANSDNPPSSRNGAMPVAEVRNAQQSLAQAKLENTSGKSLGTVEQIARNANGAPTKVRVELDQGLGLGVRSVWIDAAQLQYEPQNNVVTTTLTIGQLNDM